MEKRIKSKNQVRRLRWFALGCLAGVAGDWRSVIQIGHQLDALLEGDGIVFVLAGRGLTDEIPPDRGRCRPARCGVEKQFLSGSGF